MARDGPTLVSMCRNITALRGLEPPATAEEVEAAARQFVRKVAALSSVSPALDDNVQRASHDIALVVSRRLDGCRLDGCRPPRCRRIDVAVRAPRRNLARRTRV